MTGSRWLFVGSGLSLVPWALAGLAVGAAAADRAGAVRAGAAYGFLLAVSFMVGGRQGDLAGQWTSFVPVTALIGALGSACGAVLAIVGRAVQAKLAPHHERSRAIRS